MLRTQYGVDRADVLEVLIELMTRENIVLLGLSNASALGALPLFTFDKGLAKHGFPVAAP